MSVLKAENLTKSFNERAVVLDVSIEIHSGEIVGLLGRNGAGKTTTFQIMAGLLKANSGKIFLDDEDISGYSSPARAAEGITYLPQEHSVFLKASVMNNLNIILELQPLKKRECRKIATQLLDELGLKKLAKQSAHSLSGGERRRLEICRSLVLKPRFLLLDEPFTGIDPLTIVELQKIMLKLKQKGIGIVLSDHNVRETLKIADKAYIIDQGELLIEGTPQEIAANDMAKERFLGENFKLGDEVEFPYS